jgi:small-conductance mechanosensitive channel
MRRFILALGLAGVCVSGLCQSPGAGSAVNGPAPAGAPQGAEHPTVTLEHNSVITQAPTQLLRILRTGGERFATGFRAVTDLPALIDWARATLSDPLQRDALTQSLERIAGIGVIVFLVEWPFARRSRRSSVSEAGERPAPNERGRARYVVALERWLPRLIPIALVALLGNVLIVLLLEAFPVARSIAVGVLNAYVAVRAVMTTALILLAPDAPDGRLLPLGNVAARRMLRFVRGLVVITAFGLIGGEVAADIGVSHDVYESIQKLVALAIHIMLIIAVIRSRRVVAGWIRQIAGHGALTAAGQALAAVWPYLAVVAIAAWWLIWAWGLPGAYVRILHFVLVTGGVLFVGRLVSDFALRTIDQSLSPTLNDCSDDGPRRLSAYGGLIRATTRVVIALATLFALVESWGIPATLWFESGHAGARIASVVLKLGLLGVLTIVSWEAANALVERHVARLTRESAIQRATRVRTLQPIVRVALIATLGAIVIMTALSEIGINIAPLLAGAGIFGVALGFGSQKLVQDFITGIFLLVEDAMDVGDTVTVAGVTGTVEHLSIRTIRLRDGDGSVHLIPFSAVTTVTNTNRGVGNVPVNVSVRPTEDSDRVAAVLAEIVRGIREDPAFAPSMRSDLQLWGVDKVDGSMTTLSGQIVCTDAGRWPVQREFNRRLKKRFDELGIELSVPRQSLRIERPAPR